MSVGIDPHSTSHNKSTTDGSMPMDLAVRPSSRARRSGIVVCKSNGGIHFTKLKCQLMLTLEFLLTFTIK